MVDRPGQHEETHPTPFTYVKVALILVTLTAIEFGVFYADIPNAAMVSIFLILSSVKFILVILFYMHLKFDNQMFSGLFVGGLLLAVAVSVALMSIFQVLSTLANPEETDGDHTPVVEAPEEPTQTLDGGTVVSCLADDRVCQGRELFLSAPASAGPQGLWCSACHTVGGVSSGLIGPDLTNLGVDADGRIAGTSAEDYIRDSIRNPEEFLAPGVELAIAGLMTLSITEGLTDEEIDLMVAFLLNPVADEGTPPDDTPAVPITVAPAGDPTEAAPSSDNLVAEGEALFLTAPSNVGSQPLWCSRCHTVDGVAAGAIGPDLSHIGADAGDRIPGMSAEAYIIQSIKDPEDFVPTGVDRANAGLMTATIVQDLTEAQVEALAAFLLAQK